jgi:hypothetical protein
MHVYIADAQLPEAFMLCVAELVERLIESSQLSTALREMQTCAAAEGIDLPEIDIPDLGDLCDRESLPCRLASAAMDAKILNGTEGFLAPTAV